MENNNKSIDFLINHKLEKVDIFKNYSIPKYNKGKMISIYLKAKPLSILNKIQNKNPNLKLSSIIEKLLLDVEQKI